MDVEEMDSDVPEASASESTPSLTRENTTDCPICLQAFVQPIKLPCSHTFCFLCAKGIALQRRPCALCRTDIPLDFLTRPSEFQTRLSKMKADDISDADRYVWYYQGHKGWWQYDERTMADIEEAYIRKEKSIDILIAGAIYIIDFEAMIQYQRNTNSRKRKIKRDKVSAKKKGVAGMVVTANSPADEADNTLSPGASKSTSRQLPVGGEADRTNIATAQESGDCSSPTN